MHRFTKFFLLLSFFLISFSTYARVTVIISTPPAAQEVVYAPGGYTQCYWIQGRFHHGVWIPEHQVCEYGNVTAGNVWVSGYWQCVSYQPYSGVCQGWDWIPAHWATVNEYEYQRPWRPAYYPSTTTTYYPVSYPVYYHHHYWRH